MPNVSIGLVEIWSRAVRPLALIILLSGAMILKKPERQTSSRTIAVVTKKRPARTPEQTSDASG